MLCFASSVSPSHCIVLLQVSAGDFEKCSVSPEAKLVADCSLMRSTFTVKHTLRKHHGERDAYFLSEFRCLFVEFSSSSVTLNDLQFTNSISATSNGRKSGVDQKQLGLCLTKNMRLAVHLIRHVLSKVCFFRDFNVLLYCCEILVYILFYIFLEACFARRRN